MVMRIGRPPTGEPWDTIAFSMRADFRRELVAIAKLEGVSVSCWLRWAARSAILTHSRMGAGDKSVSGWNSRKGY